MLAGRLKYRIANFFRLLKTMNFKRIQNYLILLVGFYYASLTRKMMHKGMPLSFSVEPSNRCNLRCPECPAGMGELDRETGIIDVDLYSRILDQLAPHAMYLTLYFQGEPFLHSQFPGLVKMAKDRKLYVATSTNGHFLDVKMVQATIESGLDKIIISLDGTDEHTYTTYRKCGNFDKVTQGIRTLVRWRKELKNLSPLIVVQFIVFRHNEHQVTDIRRFASVLGADCVEIKTAQHYDLRADNPLLTSIDRYSRYRKTADGMLEPKKKPANKCRRMWSSCVITWDGLVLPCCYDKSGNYSYGSLQTSDFLAVWRSDAADHFRKTIVNRQETIKICHNCIG